MKIGLIVAIETDSIFEHYGQVEKESCPKGFEVFRTENAGNTIYIIHTGMGISAASAGTQYAITKYDVDVIVNFGVVGGLTGEMKKRRVCVVDRVVHYKYDCSEFLPLKRGQVDGHDSVFLPTDAALVEKALSLKPILTRATCCSGDKFVGTEEEKLAISREFEGDVCDMESAGIVLTCEMNGVPCILFKAVSDGLQGGAGEFFEQLNAVSLLCLETADEIMAGMGD